VATINAAGEEYQIRFRWTYIVLPASLFLLSLVLAACFYSFLPSDIAYHFQNDTPDKWLSRGAFVGWMVVPQVFFTLLSFVVVRLVMFASRYLPAGITPLPALLPIMGNMMALPQLVLIYAMLDFFFYNIHHINLMPLWVFTVIVLVLGAVVLVMLFTRTMSRYRRRRSKNHQE
jgi:uncharacterized membrane protein